MAAGTDGAVDRAAPSPSPLPGRAGTVGRPGDDRGPTWRDRLAASDPGSVRLVLAVRAVAAIVVVVGALVGVTALFGLGGTPRVVGLVLGAVLALVSTFTVADPTLGGRVVTQVCLPVTMLAAVTLSSSLAAHRPVSLGVFVLLMVAVVWARRFGPRAFACGMVAWIGYFIALFLVLPVALLGVAALGLGTATAVLLVLQVLVAPVRPARRLRRMVGAVRARVRIARWDTTHPPRGRRRTGASTALLRVNEAAVLVDGQLAIPGAVRAPGTAPAIRAAVLRVELTLAALLEASERGPDHPDERDHRDHRDHEVELDGALARLDDLVAADRAGHRPASPGPDREFTPGARLFGGFLPGSAITVGTMFGPDAERSWLADRLSLTSRQALQIGLASALTIVLGLLVSGQRWYWAVLACFLAFTGTATAAETAIKAGQRVLGTAVGVALALLVVPLLGHSVPVVLVVMLVALFAGFYLFRISYTVLALAVTVMVAELYQLMGTYSEQLLLLRVGETLLGAVVGGAVAMTFLPAPARRAESAARVQLAEALRDALVDVAAVVRDHPEPAGVTAADLHERLRALDADVHQLALIGGPLVRRTVPGAGASTVHRRLAGWITCAARVRAVVHAVEDALLADARAPLAPAHRTTVSGALDAVRGLAEGLLGGEPVARDHRRTDGDDAVLREVAALHGALVALHEIDGAAPDPAPDPVGPATGGADPDRVAGPGLARLTGSVTGTGDSAPDAVVTLIDRHGRQHGRTCTVDGRYELVLPGAGAWQLVTGAAGHAPRADRLVVPDRHRLVEHDVALTPRRSRDT